MLGRRIGDPQGIEGPAGAAADGLGLLDIETVLTGGKTLQEVQGTHLESGAAVRGFEMHVGVTEGPGLARPFLELDHGLRGGRREGASSEERSVGKEGVRTWRVGGWPVPSRKRKIDY